MWIKSIDIRQFGNLRDFSIAFQPGANVIAAPNESGKSTLIDFILVALYGMEDNREDPRASNRKRNMPWGQTSMQGAMLLQEEAFRTKTPQLYQISCEFGKQYSLDTSTLTNRTTGTELDFGGQRKGSDAIGEYFFDLPEASFRQTVYVRQMAVAIDVSEGGNSDIAGRLANLGTSGDADVSQQDVEHLLDTQYSQYTSPRRTAPPAVLVGLRRTLEKLNEARDAAVARERAEAEDLEALAALEGELDVLQRQKDAADDAVERTRFLVRAERLAKRIRETRALQTKIAETKARRQRLTACLGADGAGHLARLETDMAALDEQRAETKAALKQLAEDRAQWQEDLDAWDDLKRSAPADERRGAMDALRARLRRADQAEQDAMLKIGRHTDRLEEMQAGLGRPAWRDPERVRRTRLAGGALTILGLAAVVALVILFSKAFWWVLPVVAALAGAVVAYRSHRRLQRLDAVARKTRQLEALERDLEAARREQTEASADLQHLEAIERDMTLQQDAMDQRERALSDREHKLILDVHALAESMHDVAEHHPFLRWSRRLDDLAEGTVSEADLDREVAPEAPRVAPDVNGALRQYAQVTDGIADLRARAACWQTALDRLDEERRLMEARYETVAKRAGEPSLDDAWTALLDEASLQDFPDTPNALSAAMKLEPDPDDMTASLASREDVATRRAEALREATLAYERLQTSIQVQYRNHMRSEGIEREIRAVEQKIEDATSYVRSLDHARDALAHAGEEVRRQFSVPLQEQTASYLSYLTEGRYDDVLINEAMQLKVRLASETVPRMAEFMSGGSYDQVYLALRLAMATLLPDADKVPPLILDDVFRQFDDRRMARGLELLVKMAEEQHRQILFFTCREDDRRQAEALGFHNVIFPLD
ncbi:MAG: AAA family ATPase [Saccharofermentanales bacterium]